MLSRSRLVALVALVAPLVGAVGCSLINSYGTVEESPAGDGGASDATSSNVTGDGAPGTADGSAPDGSVGDASGSDGASIDAGIDALSDGPAVVMEAGIVDAGPPVGAIVIGGQGMVDGGYLLSVLDPTSGRELTRQAETVLGVAYDGAQGRDLWYILDTSAKSFYPTYGIDTVRLHVRQLATHSGQWTEVGSLAVPIPLGPSYVAVLNERFAYVASVPPDSGTGYELVIVDTSTPSNPSILATTPVPNDLAAAVGTPNAFSSGGYVSLISNVPGDGGPTRQLTTVDTSAAGVVTATYPLPGQSSSLDLAGMGSYTESNGTQVNIYAVAPPDTTNAQLLQYDPYNGQPATGLSPLTFQTPYNAVRFPSPLATPCNQVAVVPLGATGLAEVVAVSLATGAQSPFSLGNGATPTVVVFEPYTTTVVVAAIATSSNAPLVALSITLPATGTPTLAARGSWAPPTDITPYAMAARQPVTETNCTLPQ